MAEQQGIQNRWMLIVAIVLGIIVVIIYNTHIKSIREENKSKMLEVVVADRNLERGDRITGRHIRKDVIPFDQQDAFGKVVKWEQRDWLTARGGQRVNQDVPKGKYVMYDYVTGTKGSPPSDKIAEGMVARSIEFDTNQSVGDILTPGDTVNFLGLFPAEKGHYKTYRIFKEGVRVLNVGGTGASGTGAISSGRGMKNYRKLTIEISPDVSVKFSNLMTHLSGDLTLELRRTSANSSSTATDPTGSGGSSRTGSEIDSKLDPRLTEKSARLNLQRMFGGGGPTMPPR